MHSLSRRIIESEDTAVRWNTFLRNPDPEAPDSPENRSMRFGAGMLRLFLEQLGAVETEVRIHRPKEPEQPKVQAYCCMLIEADKQRGKTDHDISDPEQDPDYLLSWCALEIQVCTGSRDVEVDVHTQEGCPYGKEETQFHMEARIDAILAFARHAFGDGQPESTESPRFLQ